MTSKHRRRAQGWGFPEMPAGSTGPTGCDGGFVVVVLKVGTDLKFLGEDE